MAVAVVLLINWCQSFGLVAIDEQASGTPIIATRFGALPEIIREGETGFVIDSVEDAVGATERLEALEPATCRRNAETRFSDAVMAQGYVAAYESAIAAHQA